MALLAGERKRLETEPRRSGQSRTWLTLQPPCKAKAAFLTERVRSDSLLSLRASTNEELQTEILSESVENLHDWQKDFADGRQVVVGATGNCGRHVIDGLVAIGGLEPEATTVRAVTRNLESEAAVAMASLPGVELHQGDSCTPASLRPALQGASAVFVALPQSLSSAEMVSVGKGIADEAKAAGVSKVVRLSSLGLEKQGPLGQAHIQIEQHTRSLGLTLTSVRPTSFFTNFLAFDLPSIRSSSSFTSPLGTTSAVNWISPTDIGKVAAKALSSPTWDNKELNITGPSHNTVTAPAMAAMLTSISGRAISYSECAAPAVEDYAGLWTFLREGGYNVSTDVVKDVTGDDPASLEAWLQTLDLSAK